MYLHLNCERQLVHETLAGRKSSPRSTRSNNHRIIIEHYHYIHYSFAFRTTRAAKIMLLSILTWTLFIVILIIVLAKLVLKSIIVRCECATCLIGKTAIVTGGNSGLGYQTALQLAGRGCKIIVADVADGRESVRKIIDETHNADVHYKRLDLASFESVRNFVADIKRTETRLDALINNAGISGTSDESLTVDGHRYTKQINYLGAFLLTYLLADLLKKTDGSRVVFVSSILCHINNLRLNYLEDNTRTRMTSFQRTVDYGNTKALLVIAAKMFAEKLKKYNVQVYAVNPGMTYTQMHMNTYNLVGVNNHLFKLLYIKLSKTFSQTVHEGIQSILHAVLSNTISKYNGRFIANCNLAYAPWKAGNKKFCAEIWKLSEKCVGITEQESL